MALPPKSRLSFTHEQSEFRVQNPIYAQTKPLSDRFNTVQDTARETFKAKRRSETMVERQRPHPVLKPSPELAASVDRQIFNAEMASERNRARKGEALTSAISARDGLFEKLSELSAVEEERKFITPHAPDAQRQLFVLQRRARESQPARDRAITDAHDAGRTSHQFTRRR